MVRASVGNPMRLPPFCLAIIILPDRNSLGLVADICRWRLADLLLCVLHSACSRCSTWDDATALARPYAPAQRTWAVSGGLPAGTRSRRHPTLVERGPGATRLLGAAGSVPLEASRTVLVAPVSHPPQPPTPDTLPRGIRPPLSGSTRTVFRTGHIVHVPVPGHHLGSARVWLRRHRGTPTQAAPTPHHWCLRRAPAPSSSVADAPDCCAGQPCVCRSEARSLYRRVTCRFAAVAVHGPVAPPAAVAVDGGDGGDGGDE